MGRRARARPQLGATRRLRGHRAGGAGTTDRRRRQGVVLLAERRERGGAGEQRVEVPSSRNGGRAGVCGPRRPSGRRRGLVAVGLREAGYGGGGSGSCE